MRYIIMADSAGKRWENYAGMDKHMVPVEGEPLLCRTVRQVTEADHFSDIIITSHDQRLSVEGARIYSPENNRDPIDRFTEELISDDVCFLYGDTFYTDECIKMITEAKVKSLLFFGNRMSVVGIKILDGEVFREHFEKVRDMYRKGELKRCIGWQIYQSYAGLPFDDNVIGADYVDVKDGALDINTPEDYRELLRRLEKKPEV